MHEQHNDQGKTKKALASRANQQQEPELKGESPSRASRVEQFWRAMDRGDVVGALMIAPFSYSSERHGNQFHFAIEDDNGHALHRGAGASLHTAVALAAALWLSGAPSPEGR